MVTFTEEILNGKFHFLCSTSYADDTTAYFCAHDISSVIFELQRTAKKISDWCKNNHMNVNPGKCHAMLSSNTQLEIRFENTSIALSLSEKLLGITLDSELKFEKHINKIFNLVNKKLNALHRIANHMSLDKRKMLLSAFIGSQFSYCPLIWMFHSRTLNSKINRLLETGADPRLILGCCKILQKTLNI